MDSFNVGLHRKESFWRTLDKLKLQLENSKKNFKTETSFDGKENANNTTIRSSKLSRDDILQKIELMVEDAVRAISNDQLPKFTFNKRGAIKNTRYNVNEGVRFVQGCTFSEVSLSKFKSIHRYAVLMRVLCECYELIQCDTFTTKRDIYYMDVNFFQNQQSVDDAIADVACMINIPRHMLHINSAAKGLIAGNLVYKEEDGSYTDCSKANHGLPIPTDIADLSRFYSEAKYILIVEKEASFQKLLDSNITTKLGPCIILTGKGFPDINTRTMVNKLSTALSIPLLALVDCDPHGIEIMCVYRFGSRSLAFETHRLACPEIRWLGVQPADVEMFNINDDCKIQFSDLDRKKLDDLCKRDYIKANDDLRKQVDKLSCLNYKAEIQSLDCISMHFLTDVYLPAKIRMGSWL